MISKKLFGTLSDGREVDIYELKNANGVTEAQNPLDYVSPS